MVLLPDHGEQMQAQGLLLMVSRYRVGRGREWGAEACTERAWRENDEAGCLIVFLLSLDNPGQHHERKAQADFPHIEAAWCRINHGPNIQTESYGSSDPMHIVLLGNTALYTNAFMAGEQRWVTDRGIFLHHTRARDR